MAEVPARATLAPSVPEPLPYSALAEVLARLDEESSRLRIVSELSALLQRVMAESPDDLVPTLQLATAQLGPSASGIELGMGDVGMLSAVAEAAGVTLGEAKLAYDRSGDIGLVASELHFPSTNVSAAATAPAKGASAAAGPGQLAGRQLTVREVLATALEIAATSGNGAVERKAAIAARLLRAASCGSDRLYIVRTLLGRLRVGASEATVLSALGRARLALELGLPTGEEPEASAARAAEQRVRTAFRRVPNLGVLCEALLAGPLAQLDERTAPRHAVPVQPMLHTAVASVDEALQRLKGAPATFEYKYDGERVQVHVRRLRPPARAGAVAPSPRRARGRARGAAAQPAAGAACAPPAVEVCVFSRSCENVTFKFEAACAGAPGWLAAGTDEAIFEAEAVAYDRERGRILPFAQVARRPRKPPRAGAAVVAGGGEARDEPAAVSQVCLFAFDLLSLNGQSVLHASLPERRYLLHSRLLPAEGTLQFATGLDSSEPAQIASFMAQALADGCEGLMIKTLKPTASAYEPGHRSARNFKLKRDYLHGQVDTFDLVPVGAYLGKGRRAGFFGAFLLACRADEGSERLQSVCKLGSGFTDKDTAALTAAFKEGGLCQDAPAPELELGKLAPGRQPDVWLRPSAVWEVLGAEISPSPTYSAASGADGCRGLALRFPRFVRARDDKRVRDATCASQIASAYVQQLAASGNGPQQPKASAKTVLSGASDDGGRTLPIELRAPPKEFRDDEADDLAESASAAAA